MNDKITLKSAMEESAWLMVYAADPSRMIDVTMSYADLFALYKWYHESVPVVPRKCSKG